MSLSAAVITVKSVGASSNELMLVNGSKLGESFVPTKIVSVIPADFHPCMIVVETTYHFA